jgi:hypothetical protein
MFCARECILPHQPNIKGESAIRSNSGMHHLVRKWRPHFQSKGIYTRMYVICIWYRSPCSEHPGGSRGQGSHRMSIFVIIKLCGIKKMAF